MAGHGERRGLGVEQAMTIAMIVWAACLVTLLVLLSVAAVVALPGGAVAGDGAIDGWFISAMILVAVLPTAAGFVHHYLFQRRHELGVVPPATYLQASLVLWGAILIAGVWSAVGCLMTRELVPHVIPLFISLFLLMGTWPNGKAMVKPRSRESEDDTEILHNPPEDD